MSAESVGQIGLDLVVNKKDFNRQMGGIQKLAAKTGKALAAAFTVKKLVDFGAACVELGSDLQEVQNVVDVTFPTMSRQVNEFAQNAAASFGLSETMAKKFTGTFGTMAKSFGFSESAAHDMSTTLTGLAGDIASFYNITQDEAYTKLKSVFTGETESLKDLGVVMTQTALDSYALAKGFGKTTAKMTEAEKVALRYQFVQEQLTAASGDFIRTSDSWANQVKVLKLQFDSLKATIGQGLINVLTPVIKVINTLVSRLQVLANAFKSFTENIMGKSGTESAAVGMNAIAGAADNAAASTAAVGDAAKASAKKMKGLFAFDDMKVMDSPESNGTVRGGATGIANMTTPDTTATDKAAAKYQVLIDKVRELVGLFQQGFQIGLGDTEGFDSIKQSLMSLKDSFLGVFSSSEVAGAFDNFIQTTVKSVGMSAGALVSVGVSIADNFLCGLSGYLEKNSRKVQDYIVSAFEIGSRLSEIRGNFHAAIATMAESLRSDGALRITEALIGGFANAFMGLTSLCGSLAVDLSEVITAPFIDNQDLIHKSLKRTFSAVAPVFENIKDIVDECLMGLRATYDEHISPMLTAFGDGFSEIATTLLEAYTAYILPVIKGMSGKFEEFKDQYLSPLIEKLMEVIGKVADAVNVVWVNALKPAIEEFITTWAPIIGQAIQGIGQFFGDIGAFICEVIDEMLNAFGGLMDFITGVFTGNWNQAWEGIKNFFFGIWNAMYGKTNELMRAMWNAIWNIMGLIVACFTEKWNGISKHVTDTVNIIKNVVTTVFSSIWKFIKDTINNILGGIETMVNGFVDGINRMISALNNIQVDIPDWVPVLGGKSFGISLPHVENVKLPRLAQGGYVKANTPQLAMIGDNRHQGEIVAPEDKIYEISAQAMRDVMQPFMATLAALANNAQGKGITIVLKVTGEMAPFVRLLRTELEKEETRTGVNFEVVYE